MEHTHTIKLSTGKEIVLSDEEYSELKQAFREVVHEPYPYWPAYPTQPVYPWYTITTTSNTVSV